MRIFIVILILLSLIFSSCSNIQDDNSKIECSKDSDCELPMNFAIQSNCPFASICLDSKCSVACPLYYHNLNPDIIKSYQFSCNDNSDCNCKDRGNKTIECICKDSKCYSVEN